MDLTLVRHAEAVRGRPDETSDPELTERGRRQAACLAERAGHWKKPTAVLVSPLLRARQTADPLCAAVGLAPRVAPWLEEIHVQGSGLDAAGAVDRIRNEALEELRARVANGISSVLAEFGATPYPNPAPMSPPRTWTVTDSNPRLVLVGHGMAHAVALELLLGIEGVPWAGHRFQFAHAAFAGVRAFPFANEWVFGLVRYNQTDHLPPELRSY